MRGLWTAVGYRLPGIPCLAVDIQSLRDCGWRWVIVYQAFHASLLIFNPFGIVDGVGLSFTRHFMPRYSYSTPWGLWMAVGYRLPGISCLVIDIQSLRDCGRRWVIVYQAFHASLLIFNPFGVVDGGGLLFTKHFMPGY